MSLSLKENRKERLTSEWEGYCQPRNGCGTACCHYEGSPCEELQWTDKKKGIGVCRVYPKRFGLRRTINGKEFTCEPMWVRLMHVKAPDHCGYEGIRSVNGEKTKGFTV